MEDSCKLTHENAYDKANFLSRLFLWWLVPLFNKGWTRDLKSSDLFSCSTEDDPLYWANKLEGEWFKELAKFSKSPGQKPSINRALVRTFGSLYIKTSPLIWTVECIVKLLQPFLIASIVDHLLSPNVESAITIRYHVAAIVVSNFLMTIANHHGMALHSRHGNNVRSALTHLIYKKLLKLHKSSFGETDIGQIVNVIASDLNRFEELGWISIYLFAGPVGCIIALAGTYSYLGLSSLTGFVILILLIPFQGFMGKLFSRFRRETTEITDQRINLMTELVSAMKLIKVYCWEEPFSGKINQIRNEEVSKLKKTFTLEGINASVFQTAAKVILFASFVTLILGEKKNLTGKIVFFTMSMYNALRVTATKLFPMAVGLMSESLVALDRINSILLLEEKKPIQSAAGSLGEIRFDSYSAKWTRRQEANVLSDISLIIEPGELVIVIGSVGAGKTCFLHSILNEVHQTSGHLSISGQISYAPQEAWCFGASIKQNITLGADVDEVAYKKIIHACGLERDLELFELSDETSVGEKGHNLSGGQRARVNLARCVYRDSDIYLLDDPLSAVDTKIGKHIFTSCIKKYLEGKTVVLVTHQLQFLQLADKIALISEGKLVKFGTYTELSAECDEFNKLLDCAKREKERRESRSRQKSLSLRSQELEQMEEPEEEKPKTQSAAEDREEVQSTGRVTFSTVWTYFRSGGSVAFILFVLTISLVSRGSFAFADLWLAAWTQKMSSNSSSTQSIASSCVFESLESNIIFYACLMVLLFITVLIRILICYYLNLQCSIHIHKNTFERLLRSPITFFESNPLGRILNRFTRDLGIVDVLMPRTTLDVNLTMIEVLGTVVVNIVIKWIMIFPTICLTLISIPIREYYVRTARNIHRIDAIFRSPVYNYITATFDGLITIRAFGIQEKCEEQFIRYIRDSVACRFLVFYSIRFLGWLLDILSNIYILCICIILTEIVGDSGVSGTDAGLILTQSLALIDLFQYTIRQTSEFENQMTSTERILEYSYLKSEAPLVIPNKHVDNNWPYFGRIVFRSVYLRYNKNADAVLKDLSFEVEAGQKVGVVGRTGAGKSTLISILFRLVEPEGEIMIDGVDIKTLGLHDLRSKISIIPQDPSLFSGTVRRNLDPFNEYSDAEIWKSLDEAHLQHAIGKMGGLSALVSEGGSNLSVGQRQLLCMARALLKSNRILVMDEATANVDSETDLLIQSTIRNIFTNCTILTVAHRLNTIIDMDKVLVLDAGRVVEFDSPYLLLKNVSGLFYSMVKQTGPSYEKMLHSMATRAYFSRQE